MTDDPDDPERQAEVGQRLMAYAARLRREAEEGAGDAPDSSDEGASE